MTHTQDERNAIIEECARAIIEECARVAETWDKHLYPTAVPRTGVAAAIRALKDMNKSPPPSVS